MSWHDDLRKLHYVSLYACDLNLWIFNDIINMVMTFFSILPIKLFVACSSLETISLSCNYHFHWMEHKITHLWHIMGFPQTSHTVSHISYLAITPKLCTINSDMEKKVLTCNLLEHKNLLEWICPRGDRKIICRLSVSLWSGSSGSTIFYKEYLIKSYAVQSSQCFILSNYSTNLFSQP